MGLDASFVHTQTEPGQANPLLNVGLLSVRRRRWRADINPTLGERVY